VIAIMAAILSSLHMRTADDLFGTSQGSPRSDKTQRRECSVGREDHGED
jgi:hypothetical protein